MGVMTGSSTAPPRNCTVHRVATRSAALLGSAGSEDQLSIAGENAGARRAPCAFLRGGTGRPPVADTRALPSRARGRWSAPGGCFGFVEVPADDPESVGDGGVELGAVELPVGSFGDGGKPAGHRVGR